MNSSQAIPKKNSHTERSGSFTAEVCELCEASDESSERSRSFLAGMWDAESNGGTRDRGRRTKWARPSIDLAGTTADPV